MESGQRSAEAEVKRELVRERREADLGLKLAKFHSMPKEGHMPAAGSSATHGLAAAIVLPSYRLRRIRWFQAMGRGVQELPRGMV